ncbi:XrtA/PEP-CTERM system TPR-repeat protein PrsT [Roseateles sp. LYH14W]|uniref:XrtA/PEP-CTERM system TPR-repeat protein PrsT n=1 Tax=Pelomonas parva TaxID=3299032 RepID=A0ABW7EW43_9BURK
MNKATSSGVGAKRRCAAGLALSGVLLVGCFDKSAEQYLAAARVDMAKKDNAAAVIQLKNALQNNPSLAEARLLLGQALLQSGDPRGALTELGKARELGFKGDQLEPLTAQAMLGLNEFAKVISEFADTKPASNTDLADLQASLAVAYSATGNAAKAMELANAAVSGDPDNLRAQLIRVRLVAAVSGPAEGFHAVEAVLAKSPQSADGWQIQGDLLGLQGKADAAMVSYRKAITLDKAHVLARVGAFHLLLAKKDLDGAKVELDALRNARGAAGQVKLLTVLLALERNDLDGARDSMQALLKIAPEDVRVMHLAGVVAFRRSALLEAEDFLGKTLHVDPGFEEARVLLAQTQLRAGEPGKALNSLQPLLIEGGTNTSALSVAAEAYLQAGDARRAEAAFNKISKLKPNDIPSRVALSMVDIDKGRVEQGIAALRALSAADSSPVPDLALIATFMQRKDWDQALKSIEALERKTPESAGPSNLRGRIELVRGSQEKAAQAFEAALKIDPAYYPAAASLATLDVEAKKPEAALSRFQKVLAVNPKSLAANMALIGLREQTGANKEEIVAALEKLIKQMPSEPRPRLALIELHLRRQQAKEALSVAAEAVAALPNNPSVLRHLAGVHAVTGDYNQAISSYNKLISLQPTSPEPLMLLAQVYAARGDKAASRQAMERAVKLKPSFQPAQRALISSELAAGNVAEAQRLSDAMKSLYPNDPLVLSISGDVAVVRRDWAGAILNYRAALNLLSQVDVAIKLHRVLTGAGKQPEARQFESEWLARHPTDLKFMIYSADSMLLLANYDAARERYLAVLKLQPDNANAANNVAWLLNRNKDQRALEYAEKATKLAPENLDYQDTLAQILASSGRLDKAIKIQKKVVDLAPDHAARRFHLAQFYVSAGQKQLASEQLQRLAQLGDGFAQQGEVKKLIEAL